MWSLGGGVALWFFIGQPWKIRRRRTRGELNDVEVSAKVKKAILRGVLWLALAACCLIGLFDQAEFFGDSFIPVALIVMIAVGVFAALLPAMRRVDSREPTTGLTKR